jgi:uncharacterized Zn ribbon protein
MKCRECNSDLEYNMYLDRYYCKNCGIRWKEEDIIRV